MRHAEWLELTNDERYVAAYCSAVSGMIRNGVTRCRINACQRYYETVYEFMNS